MHTQTQTHTHTHTNTPVAYEGNETEKKSFEKRKVFKEDLKELTEVEWRTETGSWFHGQGILLLLPSTSLWGIYSYNIDPSSTVQ